MKYPRLFSVLTLLTLHLLTAEKSVAQPISGIWRGKITHEQGIMPRTIQVELQFIRTEDSLKGLAYYFQHKQRFVSVPISGYINPMDGTVSWWHLAPQDRDMGKIPALSFSADVNCPGEGIMLLEGESITNQGLSRNSGTVVLEKKDQPFFPDAMDETIAETKEALTKAKPLYEQTPVSTGVAGFPPAADQDAATTIEEKFAQRTRKQVAKIPLSGDTLEIQFYDHAEIDGDSISLFLNNKLLQKHILLKATAYAVKIPVHLLEAENELIMVAENLGRIPPNTSLMVAYVAGIRYEAALESNENSSAMVKFIKPTAVKR